MGEFFFEYAGLWIGLLAVAAGFLLKNVVMDLFNSRKAPAANTDDDPCHHPALIESIRTAMPPMGSRLVCENCGEYVGHLIPGPYGRPILEKLGGDKQARSGAEGNTAPRPSADAQRIEAIKTSIRSKAVATQVSKDED